MYWYGDVTKDDLQAGSMQGLLGGPRGVANRFLSTLNQVVNIAALLITLLVSTHLTQLFNYWPLIR